MPRLSTYRPAEVFLKHGNMNIYHVYKNDDADEGVREFWFDCKEDSRDDDSFDVRDLADQLGIELSCDASESDDEEAKRAVLRTAIDRGLLK